MAVTSTNNLRIGSSGEDVLELQKRLNQTNYGYNLAEDGSFGEKTQAAVRDYQQRSGLDVDGIVGTHTWGALTKANAPATTTPTQTPTTEAAGFTYKPYESQWQTQLDETLDKILNREKFSYDLNGDALYQQYKDQAVLGGQMAMMDTMGQASALTGGYGNSYAQTVGQQTYQGYLQQLNDKVPELYQLALDQYNREGDELYTQYGMYADRDEQDYGRWGDKVNLDYGMYRDQVADKQWQAQFDEAKRQYDQQYALESGSSSGGSSSSSGNGGNGDKGNTGGGFDNGGYGDEVVKQAQVFVGADDDGKWGPDSQAKAKAKGYNSIAEVVAAMGGGNPTGFTGTTYSEAVAYANANGVPNSQASMIMTRSEFSRVKASGKSKYGEHKCANYAEYLAFATERLINENSK